MKTPLDTKKMRSCSQLLPSPGAEIVIECVVEIERLRKLLFEANKLLTEMRGEHIIHGHITDASAEYMIDVKPEIESYFNSIP